MSKRKKKQQNVGEEVTQLQPGEKLRLAREARELSIADVAVRLKLNVKKINALEQGDIEGLAAPVFVAGYLRTYARLLELSEVEVLADFDELLPAQESLVDPAIKANDENYGKVASEMPRQFSLHSKSSGNRLGMVGFAGSMVLILVYFLWPSNGTVRTNIANAESTDIESAAPAPEIVITTTANEMAEADVQAEPVEERQNPMAELSAEAEQSETMPGEIVPSETVTTEVVAVPEITLEPVAAGMTSELVLSFNSDSWAEVKDARGQRLVYRLGKSGSKRTVTGLAPFMVQLGYVQGVDILYNGAVYDLSKYVNRRSVRLYIGKAGDRIGGEDVLKKTPLATRTETQINATTENTND